MENYRKVEIVGKGSFGCAVLVQNVHDRKYYIMKVPLSSYFNHHHFLTRLSMSPKWTANKRKKPSMKSLSLKLWDILILSLTENPSWTKSNIIIIENLLSRYSRYLCIVMDYAEGGDMYSKINKQKKIGKGFP